MRMGMIFIMPLPHILQAMTTTIATTGDEPVGFAVIDSEEERIRPMAMMMGPVTIGGRSA